MAIPGHGVDRNAHQPGQPYPMSDVPSRGEAAIRENFHVPMLMTGAAAGETSLNVQTVADKSG